SALGGIGSETLTASVAITAPAAYVAALGDSATASTTVDGAGTIVAPPPSLAANARLQLRGGGRRTALPPLVELPKPWINAHGGVRAPAARLLGVGTAE